MICLGRWSTAINPGSLWAVSGDEERENSSKTREIFGCIRECAPQSPISPAPDDSQVEPDPPGHWPICKLTPLWNWPKIPFLPFQKVALATTSVIVEATYSRSGPIANLEGAGISIKPELTVSWF